MKRNVIFSAVVLALAGTWLVAVADDKDKDKPKLTIKEVMKFHKDKVHEKYQQGKASKEDVEKLTEAYEALAKNKPPKGDDASWKEKTEAIVKAIKDDDKVAYKKALNCGGCHSAHKK